LAELTFDHLQQREDHWALVDLVGKAGHIPTVPVPDWVKEIIDNWVTAAGIGFWRLFRRVSRAGTVWGEAMTEGVVWHVIKEFAAKLGIPKLAPHDLRRSCARLCHAAGGELEQIQFLLGPTFRCKQLRDIWAANNGYEEPSTTGLVLSPPNDHLGRLADHTPAGLDQ
jgi:integrase